MCVKRKDYIAPKIQKLGNFLKLTKGNREHGNDIGCGGKNGNIVCS